MADKTLGEVLNVFLEGSELFVGHSVEGAERGFSAGLMGIR